MKKSCNIVLLGCLTLFLLQKNVSAQQDSEINHIQNEKMQKIESDLDLIDKKFPIIPNNELLYVGKKVYTVDRSLVSNFDGYKTIFPFAQITKLYDSNTPYVFRIREKPYTLSFEIIDNRLYLIKLNILGFDPKHLKDTSNLANISHDELYERFKVSEIFEKFTGGKFIKPENKLYKKPTHPYYQDKNIMMADWVNGTYLIKEWDNGRREGGYAESPYSVQTIEFKDGVVTATKLLYLSDD